MPVENSTTESMQWKVINLYRARYSYHNNGLANGLSG